MQSVKSIMNYSTIKNDELQAYWVWKLTNQILDKKKKINQNFCSLEGQACCFLKHCIIVTEQQASQQVSDTKIFSLQNY